jgi:hypothetical protein
LFTSVNLPYAPAVYGAKPFAHKVRLFPIKSERKKGRGAWRPGEVKGWLGKLIEGPACVAVGQDSYASEYGTLS